MDQIFYCKWLILLSVMMIAVRTSTASSGDSEWRETIATKHGYDYIAMEPYGGSCGYGDPSWVGTYSWALVSLSTALFKDGYSCGSCFDIRCDPGKSTNCTNGGTYTVMAADLCPPDRAGGWCSPPKAHLDLSAAVMTQMTWKSAFNVDTLPISYKRVPCQRTGGLKFKIRTRGKLDTIYVLNVNGAGEVKSLEYREHKNMPWVAMSHSKGPSFDTYGLLYWRTYSFRVTSSTGQTVEALYVLPYSRSSGETYQSKVNFDDSLPDSLKLSTNAM